MAHRFFANSGTVSIKTLATLRNNEWVNDEIINCVAGLIFKTFGGSGSDVLVNTFFSLRVTNEEKAERWLSRAVLGITRV